MNRSNTARNEYNEPPPVRALRVSDPQAPEESHANIARRLIAKYGKGENPAVRIKVYERIERAVDEFGAAAYRVVSGAVKSAATATYPDRYFVTCCLRRLRDAGFLSEGEEF